MTVTDPIAAMIVQSLAINLASVPERALRECGLSQSIINGIRSARSAFNDHVTESEVETLRRGLFDDISDGSRELDAAQPKGKS